MSHINYDFLTESFLFGSQIETRFASFSDAEIERELLKYRDYVMANIQEILEEIVVDSKKISVVIESFEKCPQEDILKQLALYVDVVVISDPLFEMTEEKSHSTKVMAQYLGMDSSDAVDRTKLVNAVNYMKGITSLIVCDYVKFFPISFLHEAPKQIPLTYDSDNFRNVLPDNLLKFMLENVEIHNTYRTGHGLRVEIEKPLEKGTGLYINFPRCKEFKGEVAQYMISETIDFDETTNLAKFRYYIPESISQKDFDIWVEQSLNKACIHFYNDTFNEVFLSSRMNAMYLTQSDLRAELLMGCTEQTNRAKIANTLLDLQVPVIVQSNLSDIIRIRTEYGQSFKNFRSELGAKLLHLSCVTDENAYQNELREIEYELSETCINQINQETRSLVKSLGIDASIMIGSFITSGFMNENGMLGLVAAALSATDGIKESLKYVGSVKEKPGYFLWKINRKK